MSISCKMYYYFIHVWLCEPYFLSVFSSKLLRKAPVFLVTHFAIQESAAMCHCPEFLIVLWERVLFHIIWIVICLLITAHLLHSRSFEFLGWFLGVCLWVLIFLAVKICFVIQRVGSGCTRLAWAIEGISWWYKQWSHCALKHKSKHGLFNYRLVTIKKPCCGLSFIPFPSFFLKYAKIIYLFAPDSYCK